MHLAWWLRRDHLFFKPISFNLSGINRGNLRIAKMVSTGWQYWLKPATTVAFEAFSWFVNFRSWKWLNFTDWEGADLGWGQNREERWRAEPHKKWGFNPIGSARNRSTLTVRRVVILSTFPAITGGSHSTDECEFCPLTPHIPQRYAGPD